MKIVHVIVDLNVGGAELMLKRLIDAHSALPLYEHSVVSLTDLGVIGPQLRAQGVVVSTVGLSSVLGIPSALYRLLKLIRMERPDIVQTWMYHADLLGGLAARIAGVRNVVWGVRTTDVGNGGKRSTVLIRRLCAWLSKYVPKVIVCAAEASRRAHVAVGYDSKRMLVIPNGFDVARLTANLDQRKAIRSAVGIERDQLVIGSLGRFNAVKDHANFISAAALLVVRYPKLKFLLVGRDLELSNGSLMDLVTKTGYAERFVFLGEREDVAACLKAMDIFCLHSRTEGFPNVLGEAMAMGLPCVTTNVGDAAYLLNKNGFVVPPQDPEALADALANMLELSEERRAALGKAALLRIYNDFTIARTSEKFIDLYERLISHRELSD